MILTCSGKSTQARELAQKIGTTVIEHDEILFELGIHENWSREGGTEVTSYRKRGLKN